MKNTLILGVIGADCHAVGNKILDYVLQDAGFQVVNIGVLSSQEEFIQAAIETDAAAILVSSLYGHGEIDCRGMREKCDEAGLHHVPLYIGGNLVVGKTPFEEVQRRFLGLGFSRVYPPGTSPEIAIRDLKKDLNLPELMPRSS